MILIPFQGFLSFWRGNVVNVVRYFRTQVHMSDSDQIVERSFADQQID